MVKQLKDKLNECIIIQTSILPFVIVSLFISNLNAEHISIYSPIMIYCCVFILTTNYLYRVFNNIYILAANILLNICMFFVFLALIGQGICQNIMQFKANSYSIAGIFMFLFVYAILLLLCISTFVIFQSRIIELKNRWH